MERLQLEIEVCWKVDNAMKLSERWKNSFFSLFLIWTLNKLMFDRGRGPFYAIVETTMHAFRSPFRWHNRSIDRKSIFHRAMNLIWSYIYINLKGALNVRCCVVIVFISMTSTRQQDSTQLRTHILTVSLLLLSSGCENFTFIWWCKNLKKKLSKSFRLRSVTATTCFFRIFFLSLSHFRRWLK